MGRKRHKSLDDLSVTALAKKALEMVAQEIPKDVIGKEYVKIVTHVFSLCITSSMKACLPMEKYAEQIRNLMEIIEYDLDLQKRGRDR